MKNKKKVSKSTLNWIYSRTKKFLPAIFLTSLLNILLSVILIVLAKVSKNVISAALNGSSDKMKIYSIYLFAIIIIQLILDAALSMINVYVNGKMTISMRNYMFSSIIHKKYKSVFDHHTGDLLNRFTSDIDQVVGGTIGIIPSICSMLAKIIAGISALAMQNYIFAIAVLAIGFTFPLVGRTISKKYKYMHKEVQRTEGKARSFMQESFANIVVIKTFVSELPILKKLNEYMNDNLKIKIKRSLISVFISLCLYSFFTFGYYGVLVWGAMQITVGVFSYDTLYYFLELISILRNPLQNISGIIPQYYSACASAERLMDLEIIEDEPAVMENNNLKLLKSSFNSIKINNVAFGYSDEEIILKNCSFEIPKNQITAITGESGSGKSTLFKLILGLYEPIGGEITFDGTTPIDASTRGMFSYVPQGNMILSGTIRDNLTLCDATIPEERIISAAKAAVIYDYIATLPNGFDTVLSERGAGLSEGQIQRISIARALLFDTPVLLLDESTSALDEQTETQLLSNIKNMTDKTVLFITHRNTSISVCDHIVHVDGKKFTVVK